MLTDTELRKLRPKEKSFKVADRDGLYVTISTTGTKSFRYDYRLNSRRETLTIGRYDDAAGAKNPRDPDALDFGMTVSLAEARSLLAVARRCVERGESPSRTKVEKRQEAAEALTFGGWAEKYFADKADPNNGARLADSTLAMRRSVYRRYLQGPFGKLKLDEISAPQLMTHCESIREKGAAAPAVQVREIVLLVYRFAIAKDKSLSVKNPAEAIRPSDIATFKARDRALTPTEIRRFLAALDTTATAATLRLALRFVMLTLVRKGEFVNATWKEVDFDAATWIIPKERMKTSKPHVVYLSSQAQDVLVTFKTCFSASQYLHPGRYDMDTPISNATLNRVIEVAVEAIRAKGEDFESFTVHDLRRTASSLLNEAGFNRDWIEKCLAHEEGSIRGVYNKAEYGEQRRVMLQAWADMIDAWSKGEGVKDIVRAAKIAAADVTMDLN
jgi:integrase